MKPLVDKSFYDNYSLITTIAGGLLIFNFIDSSILLYLVIILFVIIILLYSIIFFCKKKGLKIDYLYFKIKDLSQITLILMLLSYFYQKYNEPSIQSSKLIQYSTPLIYNGDTIYYLTRLGIDSLINVTISDTILFRLEKTIYPINSCTDLNSIEDIPNFYPEGRIDEYKYQQLNLACKILSHSSRSGDCYQNYTKNALMDYKKLPDELLFSTGSSIGQVLSNHRLSNRTIGDTYANISPSKISIEEGCISLIYNKEYFKLCEHFQADINGDNKCDMLVSATNYLGEMSFSKLFVISRQSRDHKYTLLY